MDNREIDEIVLGIKLPEILEAIIEVFGEEYRDIILERSKDVTFFGRVASSNSTEMYVDLAIKSLTDFCDNCPIDKNREEQIILAQQKIIKLQKAKEFLIEKNDKISKLQSEKDKIIAGKLEECYSKMPNNKALHHEIYYFCNDYDGATIDNFYIKKFASLLGINAIDLMQNEEFNIILKFANEIAEIRNEYDNKINKEKSISLSALEKIKDLELSQYQTEDEINNAFLHWFVSMTSGGTTYLLEGIDGLMKILVGISINMDTTDRTIIHEIIHVVTSFAKDGKYFSGFCCNDDISEEYVNLLEVCVDWLAVKVLLVYLRDNFPMVNPSISQTLYSRCFVDCAYFLERFEKQIINALMSDNPLSFRDFIGAGVFDKMDNIMGKIMNQKDLTPDERHLLDNFASPTSNIN